MITKGPAKQLTIYVDETDAFHGRPVYEVLAEIFYKKRVSGVSIFRGVAGYGSDGVFHAAKVLALSSSMPVKIEVVDSAEVIERVLPDVYHVVEKGMVEVSETEVVKCCRNAPEARAAQGEHLKLEGKAKMLRVIVSEDDRWEGEPLYEAIVKRLIANDIAGATVYKAVAGYGPHRRYHKKKTLTGHGELPVLVTVMDKEENINKVLPIFDELVNEGIVVLSDVNVIKYTHRDMGGEEV